MQTKTLNIKELKTTLQLIKDISRVITRIRISDIEKSISMIDKFHTQKEAIQLFILKSVAGKYRISANEILTSNKRGIITDARKMCFLFFLKFLYKSQKDIAIFFKKDIAVVNRAIMEFKNMNEKIKHEKMFLYNYKELDNLIQDLIKKQ